MASKNRLVPTGKPREIEVRHGLLKSHLRMQVIRYRHGPRMISLVETERFVILTLGMSVII